MEKLFYGKSDDQFGELTLPEGDGPHPVAVLIHGGFWRESFKLDQMHTLAEDLAAHGFAVWNIEYRRVGQAGGAWPGTLTDTAAACDHLKELAQDYPLDLERAVTIGHSAGGHLALWLAGRHRLSSDSELYVHEPQKIAAAVSLAGVSDLERMYEVHDFRTKALGIDGENPTADLLMAAPHDEPGRYRDASPISLLPIAVPQVLIHGSLDVNVPVGISDHYHRDAEEAGDFIKFVELPEAEHFMLVDVHTEAWARVREEMLLLLKMI